MTTRVDIIDQLYDDIKGKYSKSNSYDFDLMKLDIASPDTFNTKQFPSVSFYGYGDPILEETLSGPNQRSFQILLTGYVKASVWRDIYRLCEDMEKFLYSTDCELNIKLDEAGPRFYSNTTMLAAGLACFDLEFNIQYTQNI